MRKFTSQFCAAVAGAVATAIIVGGVAIAQTSTTGVITACVAENGGNVRIVSSAADCRAKETSTSWNREGPRGIPGTNGANGVSGWVLVEGPTTTVEPHRAGQPAEVHCPQGKRVLGGGYRSAFEAVMPIGSEGLFKAFNVVASYPSNEQTWVVLIYNDREADIEVRPYAICATFF